MYLSVANISKSFAGQMALKQISFAVGQGEFVCLLGPSGCGKTTLLRIIAGLVPPDQGSLTLAGRDMTQLAARERNFGIVFQSYSLFPNMTVAENIGYGMRLRHRAGHDIATRCEALLQLIQLPGMGARYPWQLSGGQQQRVALARALAVDPALLLLDEPLSALDARVREHMRDQIHTIQRSLGVPTLMVTHDQDEAMALADTVICMNHGSIEQIGSPRALYERPQTRFVAQFVGKSNLLGTAWIRDNLPALLQDRPPTPDQDHEACVRPENIQVTGADDGQGVVRQATFLGSIVRLEVLWRSQVLLVEQHRQCTLQPGDRVNVEVAPRHCIWVLA